MIRTSLPPIGHQPTVPQRIARDDGPVSDSTMSPRPRMPSPGESNRWSSTSNPSIHEGERGLYQHASLNAVTRRIGA